MAQDSGLTLSAIAKIVADEEEAYKLLESLRWHDGPVCPHCGAVGGHYFLQAQNGLRKTRTGHETYRRVWKCKDCRRQFSVLVGTVFEGSHIPVAKWLLAINMLCSAKNGIAAYELHRTLGITRRSAWFMAHRIRYAMSVGTVLGKMTGTVEIDETYFGGEAKNMHAKDRERKITGRGTSNKIPVVTLVKRDGTARSQALKKVNRENIREILTTHVDESADLKTDQSSVYTGSESIVASHETFDHSKGEYVRGTAHTNTAEGYFSQLKRSIDGTHHHVSERHLDRYLSEFDYRYNTRKAKDGERMAMAIRQATGKRLLYRDSSSGST